MENVECPLCLYISYVMPPAAGILAYGKSWKKMGPFDLGGPSYKTIGVITMLDVFALIYVGGQPPNRLAIPVTLGIMVLLAIIWHGGLKKCFAGLLMALAAQTVELKKEEVGTNNDC
ncbi:MAG: hypothetical protein EXS25_09755 [Pedosphaera sp.]|nr:hypothetical protein [Pedosphaera sp.]